MSRLRPDTGMNVETKRVTIWKKQVYLYQARNLIDLCDLGSREEVVTISHVCSRDIYRCSLGSAEKDLVTIAQSNRQGIFIFVVSVARKLSWLQSHTFHSRDIYLLVSVVRRWSQSHSDRSLREIIKYLLVSVVRWGWPHSRSDHFVRLNCSTYLKGSLRDLYQGLTDLAWSGRNTNLAT